MDYLQKIKTVTNKKLLITFIPLLILNSICIILLTSRTGAYNLDGSYSEANSFGLIVSALMGVFFAMPLVLFLLVAFIAIFINKQLPYRKRFVRIYLFVIVVFYSIFFLRLLYNIIVN